MFAKGPHTPCRRHWPGRLRRRGSTSAPGTPAATTHACSRFTGCRLTGRSRMRCLKSSFSRSSRRRCRTAPAHLRVHLVAKAAAIRTHRDPRRNCRRQDLCVGFAQILEIPRRLRLVVVCAIQGVELVGRRQQQHRRPRCHVWREVPARDACSRCLQAPGYGKHGGHARGTVQVSVCPDAG